jgi:hypothetical protein
MLYQPAGVLFLEATTCDGAAQFMTALFDLSISALGNVKVSSRTQSVVYQQLHQRSALGVKCSGSSRPGCS